MKTLFMTAESIMMAFSKYVPTDKNLTVPARHPVYPIASDDHCPLRQATDKMETAE